MVVKLKAVRMLHCVVLFVNPYNYQVLYAERLFSAEKTAACSELSGLRNPEFP